MKIVEAFRINGRGQALITDEAFTPSALAQARTRKKLRIKGTERIVELEIIDTGAVLKIGGKEYLGFLVPFISDESIPTFIVNRDVEFT